MNDEADRPPAEPPIPSDAAVRASDAEREAAVGQLNEACGEGRLTLEEFSDRVGLAYEATTRGELARLLSDLPAPAPARRDAEPAPRQWHISPIGGMTRRGRWRLRRNTVAVTLIGGAELDLRDVELEAPEVVLTTVSIIGGVELKIPPGVRLEVEGFTLIGGNQIDIDDPTGPGAPTLRVRTFTLIGGVQARSTRPRDRSGRWRRLSSGS